ncbi:hypothetical protein KPE71_14015 [Acinetobacter soli]|uniref:hypothetical protein n=1 Tax=Acinetobacter soli TaxID=487316 RepID=UPI001C0C2932|nr:hypothetical protein [Acinetobacter soli]MBU3121368.1 hypothetical protein [Acinetobacter soli]
MNNLKKILLVLMFLTTNACTESSKELNTNSQESELSRKIPESAFNDVEKVPNLLEDRFYRQAVMSRLKPDQLVIFCGHYQRLVEVDRALINIEIPDVIEGDVVSPFKPVELVFRGGPYALKGDTICVKGIYRGIQEYNNNAVGLYLVPVVERLYSVNSGDSIEKREAFIAKRIKAS